MDYDSDIRGDFPSYDETKMIDHPFLGKLRIPEGFVFETNKDEIIKNWETKYRNLEEKYKKLEEKYKNLEKNNE